VWQSDLTYMDERASASTTTCVASRTSSGRATRPPGGWQITVWSHDRLILVWENMIIDNKSTSPPGGTVLTVRTDEIVQDRLGTSESTDVGVVDHDAVLPIRYRCCPTTPSRSRSATRSSRCRKPNAAPPRRERGVRRSGETYLLVISLYFFSRSSRPPMPRNACSG
jgi:hypothetical protein